MTMQPEPQHWGVDDADLDLGISSRAVDPREVADEVKESLGIDVPRRRYRPPEHPDVSGLREQMGV